mmetsp:Transcript_9675/g.14105  ORF Transcript_9675/g.14105 Transcript_9675/m.14105 type:complete len:232 (-) Transcript_9675:25-720(-)
MISPEINSFNAVADHYLRLSQISKAVEILEKANETEIIPNERTYGSLTAAFCNERDFDGVLDLIKWMRRFSVTPSRRVHRSVFDAFSRDPNWIQLLDALETSRRRVVEERIQAEDREAKMLEEEAKQAELELEDDVGDGEDTERAQEEEDEEDEEDEFEYSEFEDAVESYMDEIEYLDGVVDTPEDDEIPGELVEPLKRENVEKEEQDEALSKVGLRLTLLEGVLPPRETN